MIVNRSPGPLDATLREEAEKQQLNLLGVVPADEKVYEYDLNGRPIINLPDESRAVKTVNELMSKIILN